VIWQQKGFLKKKELFLTRKRAGKLEKGANESNVESPDQAEASSAGAHLAKD
jgi:hypothetical protein